MILALDIGSKTQDLLLYEEGREMENMVKMILPSPTSLVAKEIKEATRRGQDITLVGHLMGGGPSTQAIIKHLEEGFAVYSFEGPALTFKDNLKRVQEMGVQIVREVPQGTQPITMGDLRLQSIKRALQAFHLKMPTQFALAVQDHGFAPYSSNRKLRFQYFEGFLQGGGDLKDLAYQKIPDLFTRMKALKEVLSEAMVMDTGAAAIWGSLGDTEVKRAASDGGVVLINIGNAHTLMALLYSSKIYGILEHHTSLFGGDRLMDLILAFQKGQVTNEEIFNEKGHGVSYQETIPKRPFDLIAVTGPRRRLLENYQVHLAAPYGDMMLTGCFGLIKGWQSLTPHV